MSELEWLERQIQELDKKIFNLRGNLHDQAQSFRSVLINRAKEIRENSSDERSIDDIRRAVKFAGKSREYTRWKT